MGIEILWVSIHGNLWSFICLTYNICIAWFLDIGISTCSSCHWYYLCIPYPVPLQYMKIVLFDSDLLGISLWSITWTFPNCMYFFTFYILHTCTITIKIVVFVYNYNYLYEGVMPAFSNNTYFFLSHVTFDMVFYSFSVSL